VVAFELKDRGQVHKPSRRLGLFVGNALAFLVILRRLMANNRVSGDNQTLSRAPALLATSLATRTHYFCGTIGKLTAVFAAKNVRSNPYDRKKRTSLRS
jgi:hypothetical protein